MFKFIFSFFDHLRLKLTTEFHFISRSIHIIISLYLIIGGLILSSWVCFLAIIYSVIISYGYSSLIGFISLLTTNLIFLLSVIIMLRKRNKLITLASIQKRLRK